MLKCSFSGSNGSRFLASMVVCAHLATAQQYYCHYPNIAPWYGVAWEGNHVAAHNAWIPGSWVYGPTPCVYYFGYTPVLITKKYKGDGYPVQDGYPIQSARTYHAIAWNSAGFYGVSRGVGTTNNYGAYSPGNGQTLSFVDEDGRAGDCFLWHQRDWAGTNSWVQDVTFPYYRQAQAHLTGLGTNPLEQNYGGISWDTRVLLDTSNLDYIRAYANVTHSCFPGHVVSLNDKIIYRYDPPRNDANYIFSCLALQQNKIQGYITPTQQVPCN